MSCLNYWWLWKKLEGLCDAGLERRQLNRPAAPPGVRLALENTTESTLTLGCLWKPTVIIVPLSLGVKPAEHSHWTQETTDHRLSGGNKPWEVSSHRTTRARLHDWQQSFSLFCLGWMCIPEDTHARTHENDQQSYRDFTSFCSLWAWVTFQSDFIVSVRFQLMMMMILSRCLAIF